jgi:tetratricopeptide (TPR) repeat protein
LSQAQTWTLLRRRLKEVAAATPKRLLAVLKEVAAAASKWAFLAIFILLACKVLYDANRIRHEVLIDNIVVPKVFEEQGYTSQVILDRVRNEIEQIQREAQTNDPNKVELAAASEVELPDITLPMAGLSYRSIVGLLQETLGWRPQRVTGEITAAAQDPSKESFLASVHVENFTRTSVASFRQTMVKDTDPEKIASTMAEDILHLTSPYVLASYFKAKQDNTEALKLIEEGADDSQEENLGLSLQAAIYVTQHKFAEAINTFKTLIGKDRNFVDAHRLLAIALLEQQPPDVVGAIEEFEKAIRKDHKNVDAHNGLGSALLVNKQPPDVDGAITEFKTAIKIEPNSAFAYNGWGYALLAKQPPKVDDALVEFREAINIDPKFGVAQSNLVSAYQTKQCLTAFATDPKSASARDCLGGALLAKRPPDVDGAIVEFREATKIDPKSAFAHNRLGYAFLAKQPLQPHYVDDAIVEFRKAIEKDKNFAIAHSNLDSALHTTQCLSIDGGGESGARDHTDYPEEIASDPKSVSQRQCDCLGDALLVKRPPDLDGGIAEYQTAIAIDPHDSHARDSLGHALLVKQPPDVHGAIAEFRDAIKIDPRSAFAYTGWGDALLLKQPPDVDDAIAEYRTAIQIDPNFAIAYRNCADSLDREGKWSEALEMYCEYLELAPRARDGHAAIESMIERIPDLATVKFERVSKCSDSRTGKYINGRITYWSHRTRQ